MASQACCHQNEVSSARLHVCDHVSVAVIGIVEEEAQVGP